MVTINGEPVTDRQSSISQIADVAPGAPIELEIWRQGQTFTVTCGGRHSPDQLALETSAAKPR